MTELELERALADLAAHLEQPPAPTLADAVMARITERPTSAERTVAVRLPRRGWRRLAVAALALLVLAGGIVVATPSAREAVARRLGLRGVEIHLGPTPTITTLRPGAGASLGLGRHVTLDEARAAVGFRLLVPTAPGFQRPDAVYLSTDVPGGRVDVVYLPRPGLRASPFTNVGLLITQFQGTPFADKCAKTATRLEQVMVGGERGYWLTGEPHGFVYQDRGGNMRDETARLAGATLLWTHGPLTLRLEGQVSKQEALRLAESMR